MTLLKFQLHTTWWKAIVSSVVLSMVVLGCGSGEENPADLLKKSAGVLAVPKGQWNCSKVTSSDGVGDHFALSQITFDEQSVILEECGVPHRMTAEWNFTTTPTRLQLTSTDQSMIRFAFLAHYRQGQLRMALRSDRWPDDFADPSAIQLTLDAATQSQPVVIFMVHGCFDGVSDWDRTQPDKVTFASELKSAFGDECQIVPSTWSGTLEHADRILAAQSLAEKIDSADFAGHRVFIVAHSHGGNIALAACGRIQRQVEAVVCLATPHVHLTMKSRDNQPVLLPVYFSEKAKQKIGRLLCMIPQSDSVVNTFANYVIGITTQQALNETEDWRKLKDYPQFQDGHKVRFELLRRLLGIQREHDLIVTGTLTAADQNLTVSSEVLGIESHSAIHSRRLGRLLGAWLRSADRVTAEHYLAGLVLPVDADYGTSVSIDEHQRSLERHKDSVTGCGWILAKAEVTGVTEKGLKNNSMDFWDVQSVAKYAPPDIYLAMENVGVEQRITDTSDDSFSASFSPCSHFGHSKRVSCCVIDSDTEKTTLLGKTVNHLVRKFVVRPIAPLLDDRMGAVEINLPALNSGKAPESEFQNPNFHLKLDWVRGHY